MILRPLHGNQLAMSGDIFGCRYFSVRRWWWGGWGVAGLQGTGWWLLTMCYPAPKRPQRQAEGPRCQVTGRSSLPGSPKGCIERDTKPSRPTSQLSARRALRPQWFHLPASLPQCRRWGDGA